MDMEVDSPDVNISEVNVEEVLDGEWPPAVPPNGAPSTSNDTDDPVVLQYISGAITLDAYLSQVEDSEDDHYSRTIGPHDDVEMGESGAQHEVDIKVEPNASDNEGGDDDDNVAHGHGNELPKLVPASDIQSEWDGGAGGEAAPVDEDDVEGDSSAPDESSKGKASGSGGGRQRRSKLNVFQRNMMGLANLEFAKGNANKAIKLCHDIIKETPHANEPFLTLAAIYDATNDLKKAWDMRLIAAHLSCNDKDTWKELSNRQVRDNNHKEAALCLSKAIKLDPLDVSLWERRADVMYRGGLSSSANYGLFRLLTKLDPQTQLDDLLRMGFKVAMTYYKEGDNERALRALDLLFDKCPFSLSISDVNLFLEVLITLKKFDRCFELFTNYCGVFFEFEEDPQFAERGGGLEADQVGVLTGKRVIECSLEDENLIWDIRAKLIVFLVHYWAWEVAAKHTKMLLTQSAEDLGDLYLTVGSVYYDAGRFAEVIPLLEPLLTTTQFTVDMVWFRLAHSYKEIGQVERSLDVYRQGLLKFPHDEELKKKFCQQLMEANLFEEVLQVTADGQHVSTLMYERCKVYQRMGPHQEDNFLKTGWQLFRLHCKEIVDSNDYMVFQGVYNTSKVVKDMMHTVVPQNYDTSVSLDDEWDIYEAMAAIYFRRCHYDMIIELAASLCLSFKFQSRRSDLRMAIVVACCHMDTSDLGFNVLRDIAHSNRINTNRLWNTLNMLPVEYSRLHKFMTRFLRKRSDSRVVMMFANHSLIAGSYKYSLNDHVFLFKERPTPLLALIIGVTFSQIACQKFATNKHAIVTHALVFFDKYRNMRESYAPQEVFYNLGRFFHRLEMLPMAMTYYKQCLEAEPVMGLEQYDMKCQAAYNLHLIYMNSKQPSLANMYLEKYCEI